MLKEFHVDTIVFNLSNLNLIIILDFILKLEFF